jgi:hypothetical protein
VLRSAAKTGRAFLASCPALCRASTRRRYANPVALAQRPGVDGRDKPGHDGETLASATTNMLMRWSSKPYVLRSHTRRQCEEHSDEAQFRGRAKLPKGKTIT